MVLQEEYRIQIWYDSGKYVIYRSETKSLEEVMYFSVEEYLKSLQNQQ